MANRAPYKKSRTEYGNSRDFGVAVFAKLHFGQTKGVVGVDKHLKHSLQSFQFAWETAAAAGQNGYVMPQVGVNAFDLESIVLVVDVAHVLARIDLTSFQARRFFIQLYTLALLMPKILPTPRPLTPA